jgi:hypothetical protein
MATSTQGSVAAWEVTFHLDGDESVHAAISIPLADCPRIMKLDRRHSKYCRSFYMMHVRRPKDILFGAMKIKNIRIHNRPAYNSEVHATRDMGVGGHGRPLSRNSENSKANRIETMKGPAEFGQISEFFTPPLLVSTSARSFLW